MAGTYVGGDAMDEEQLAHFVTVVELFQRIRDAITSGAEVVEVEFDPTRGYPREAWIDPEGQVADDEVGYHLELVEPTS